MCASIALSKKFTWCLSCPSDTYSSSVLLLATARNYFTDAWHAESLVCDKKIYSHTQKQRISNDRSDPRSELPHEQIKISLWILNPGKIIFRIHWRVGPFTPSLKCYRQLRIKMTHNRALSNELLRLKKSFFMWVSPLDGDVFVG